MSFKSCYFDLPSRLEGQWEANRELLSRHHLLTLDPEKAFMRTSFEDLILHCSAKQIKSLNIEHAKLRDKEIPLLTKISTLEKLRLGPYCYIRDKGLSCLAKLPLQTLWIARASAITLSGFKTLSTMRLQQLTLGVGRKLNLSEWRELSKLTKLTALDLGAISGISTDLAKRRLPKLQFFNGRKIGSESRLGIDNMPTVLLVEVLNYLEHPREDALLRRVCQQLRNLPRPFQGNLCLGGRTTLTTLLEKYRRERICTMKINCSVTNYASSITAILSLPSLKKLWIRGCFINDYEKNLAVKTPLEELYLDEARPLSMSGVVSWLWFEQLTKLQTFSFTFKNLEECVVSVRQLDEKMWSILGTLPLRKIKIAHQREMLDDFKRALNHPTIKEISMGPSWGFDDTVVKNLLKTHKDGFAKLDKLEFGLSKTALSTLEALLQLPLQELRLDGLSLHKKEYYNYVEKNPQWKGANFGTFVRKEDALFLDKEPKILYQMYPSPEDQHLFKHFSFMIRSKLREKQDQLIVKPINPQPIDPAYEISDISFAIDVDHLNEIEPPLAKDTPDSSYSKSRKRGD